MLLGGRGEDDERGALGRVYVRSVIRGVRPERYQQGVRYIYRKSGRTEEGGEPRIAYASVWVDWWGWMGSRFVVYATIHCGR